MQKETITISFPGKYGPNINGTFYNVDQKSGINPQSFEKGKTYDVLVQVSSTGKKYIKQIVGAQIVGSVVNSVAQVEPSTCTTVKPGDDKVLEVIKKENKKEVDWDKKTAQIQAQGCIQASVQSPGLQMLLTSTYEEYWKNVERLAKDMMKFIHENS